MFKRFFLSFMFLLMLHAAPAWAVNCPTCNTASEGKICYATDDKALMICNGSTWVNQSASCGLAMPSHSCGTCNTANNGKICYETTAGLTFFCNGTSWRGTRLMTPAPVTSLNACGYTEKGVIGTWSDGQSTLNVETRQFTRNGQNEWILTTTVPNSPIDKHFPRGDNFLASVTLNGSFNGSCLNGGETAWYGLSKPSGLTTPAHYEAGTEADGAEFFKHKEYCANVGPIQCWGGTTGTPSISIKSVSEGFGGFGAMCAIKSDNTVQCWGSASYGGTTPSPVISAKSIKSSAQAVCAIKTDDTVQCWGNAASYGGSTPSPVISASTLIPTYWGFCAIRTNGTLQCWGSDQWNAPTNIVNPKSVVASGYSTCAIKSDNTVQCWGDTVRGGTTPSPVISAKSISGSGAGFCAIKMDDTVQCWGLQRISPQTSYTTPSPTITAKSIASYPEPDINTPGWMCAIKMDDTVQCWGALTTPSPTISAKSIVGTGYGACAIKLDDTVQCWGGGYNIVTPSPVITAKEIVSNSDTICAIKMDNMAQCWGNVINPNVTVQSIGTARNTMCAIK